MNDFLAVCTGLAAIYTVVYLGCQVFLWLAGAPLN